MLVWHFVCRILWECSLEVGVPLMCSATWLAPQLLLHRCLQVCGCSETTTLTCPCTHAMSCYFMMTSLSTGWVHSIGIASARGHVSTVQLLVEAGASLDVQANVSVT